jgi:hypothetical protein
MNMNFALADGTCAGLKLPDGLQHEAIGAVDVPCSEKDVSVVFYVANEQSLGRVMRRFGTPVSLGGTGAFHEQQLEGA